jgi:biopolymer transport protein ExbB
MILTQELQAESAAATAEEQSISVIDLIASGGTGSVVIIGILFVLLFVALYIYFERIFAIKAASKIDNNFMNQIRDHIVNGKIEAARLLCAQTNSPVARLIEKGVARIGKPLDDINKAIENAGTLEVYKLEKNVNILATVAGSAPMIGFLGTVIGIYTAMTTTVAGLVVGIIAYIGYNHLVNRTEKVVHQMEANAVDFLDLLNEPI